MASASVSGAIDRLNQSESQLSAQESALQTTQSQARATLAAAQSGPAGRAGRARQPAGDAFEAQGPHRHAGGPAAGGPGRRPGRRLPGAPRRRHSDCDSARPRPAAPVPAVPGGGGAEAVAAAESQIGVPYVWAGATPGVGFDCSGLTMWAWAHAGVSLSHSAAAQYAETVHVPLSDLQPGDLLFYQEGDTIGHVTMYVGPGQMVQAMETGHQHPGHRDLDERARRRRPALSRRTAEALRLSRLASGGAPRPASASHSGGILPSTPGARGPGGRPKR